MFTPPPNSQCVADERMVPQGAPPFRWAVYATAELPADVVAFYARALGRGPDEAGCKWGEPPDHPRHSLAVFPADQPGQIPPSARAAVPTDARTVVLVIERTEVAPAPHRYQNNELPPGLSPASLLEATRDGRLVWAASDQGQVLKAGGRATKGLHAGREIWITISRRGHEYLLALTSGPSPYGEPVRQTNGWLRRCELSRLWDAALRTADAGPTADAEGRM